MTMYKQIHCESSLKYLLKITGVCYKYSDFESGSYDKLIYRQDIGIFQDPQFKHGKC